MCPLPAYNMWGHKNRGARVVTAFFLITFIGPLPTSNFGEEARGETFLSLGYWRRSARAQGSDGEGRGRRRTAEMSLMVDATVLLHVRGCGIVYAITQNEAGHSNDGR